MSKFSHQEMYKSPKSLSECLKSGSPSRRVPGSCGSEVDSPNNMWRNAYKKRCFEEFKKSRQKLISRFRNCQLDGDNQPVKVKDIIEEELGKICLLEAKTSPDLLSIEEAAELYDQIEKEILLSIMQDSEDELNQRLIQEYEAEQSQLEQSYEEELTNVLCPICQRANLIEDDSFIKCQNANAGQCAFGVDKKRSLVSLNEIAKRLESAMSEHNCVEVPKFEMLDRSLRMLCDKCSFNKAIF